MDARFYMRGRANGSDARFYMRGRANGSDAGFYMRMSPYYGRTLYDRTNGLNAGFNIRKSPFMDEYRANGSKAETFTKE